MEKQTARLGFLYSIPLLTILIIGFLAPMAVVAIFSTMPEKVFDFAHLPSFEAYSTFIEGGYYRSLFWSLSIAFISTLILLLISWPLAYAMSKVFHKFTLFITLLVVMSLFVSENIRLFGWVLTLMKGGLIEGTMRNWFGVGFDGLLYNVPVIIFGIIYVYLPFMLFPLAQGIAMVPDDARQAAADLGATRWQILREIELPLAAPGIAVGCLLTFVLAAGAMSESKILGGQVVIVMADEIETAFTYGQNWPLGSALSMILIIIIGALAIYGISKVDLDAVMGRRGS